MKGYYLFAPIEPDCQEAYSGVAKKAHGQCAALNQFFATEMVFRPVEQQCFLQKIYSRLPFLPVSSRNWNYRGEFHDADFLYIRQVQHDYPFIRYLKKIKGDNPMIKIIYEVPTYPYETERHTNWKNVHVTLKDEINKRKLKKYIDRVVTFYGQDRIFDIPTLKLINGFDFSRLALPRQRHLIDDEIHVVEVSTTAFWHGYDRFIDGMHRYYANGGTTNIVFHMVGNVLPELQELVEHYKLNSHVILHGRKAGPELDGIYEQCSLGIDVLGGHRKNYPVSSSLKSREYAAKGLPVITASPVDYLPRDCKWQLVVPYDDTPVDIDRVIDFYHACYTEEPTRLMNEIRSFAEGHCSMRATMLPVIEYLEGKYK